MEDSVKNVKARLRGLFDLQRFAVLATLDGASPYASLMTFAVTDDLKHVILVTSRETRKYDNLRKNSRVALLIDSRSNKESDVKEAVAVTVIGDARESEEDERERLLGLYRKKHPLLDEFARSPSQALINVTVQSYVVVNGLQDVSEFSPAP